MLPRKKPEMLWSNNYRKTVLSGRREEARLGMQAYRARKKAEAAAAEDESGPPVTKKARVRGSDGNNGNAPSKAHAETNAAHTTERRRKTATKSDKPAEVQTTRRTRAMVESCNGNEASNDETTNGKEGKDTEAEPDDTFDPTSADLPSGEGRTSRRRNKKTKEPAANKASTQALETGLAKDTDDIMVIAADEAPIPIDLANGTEDAVKICNENISKDDKHVEVEPQAAQVVSTTSYLMNQPFVVIVSHSTSNYVHQERCSTSSISDSNIQIKSTSINQESGIISGTIGSYNRTSNEDNVFVRSKQIEFQGYPGFGAVSEAQIQTSHDEEHNIDPTENEGKISTEDTSATQDDKHIEVESQAAQQGCTSDGTYEQHAGWIEQCQSQNAIALIQQAACYTDETQVQTSHEEEHDIVPTQGQPSDDTSTTDTTQEATTHATTRISTSDTTATETQDAGTTHSQR